VLVVPHDEHASPPDSGSALRNILCDALSPFRGFRDDLDPKEVKSAFTKSK
jgi:hypothetical protein